MSYGGMRLAAQPTRQLTPDEEWNSFYIIIRTLDYIGAFEEIPLLQRQRVRFIRQVGHRFIKHCRLSYVYVH